MTNFDIESTDFALSVQGIHLLRNRFNYKTISFYEVNKATFTRAVETKNVAITLIAGTLLLAFAVYEATGVYENFYDPAVRHIYVESIMLPVLPFLLGLYCIYIAVKKVPLLLIELNGEKHKLSLKNIDAGRMAVLETFLKKKTERKVL